MKLSFPLFLLFAATIDVSAEIAPRERRLKNEKNQYKKKCETNAYLVPQIADALTFIPAGNEAISLATGTHICLTGESLMEVSSSVDGDGQVSAQFFTLSALVAAAVGAVSSAVTSLAATSAVAAVGTAAATAVVAGASGALVNAALGGRSLQDGTEFKICAGDRMVASPKRVFKNNSPVGFLTFTNTFVSAEEILSTGVLFFEDGSDITYTGYSGSAMGIGPQFALTGGTGKYDGVHGTATFGMPNGVDVSVEIMSCF